MIRVRPLFYLMSLLYIRALVCKVKVVKEAQCFIHQADGAVAFSGLFISIIMLVSYQSAYPADIFLTHRCFF